MAYKTVLVHCNDKDRVAHLAEFAAQVAAQSGAHLIGLSVTPPVYGVVGVLRGRNHV